MIKYFNQGGELFLQNEHKHAWKVPTILLEDLSLQAYSMNEIIDLKEKRYEDSPDTIEIQIEIPDYFDLEENIPQDPSEPKVHKIR